MTALSIILMAFIVAQGFVLAWLYRKYARLVYHARRLKLINGYYTAALQEAAEHYKEYKERSEYYMRQTYGPGRVILRNNTTQENE